MDIVFYAANKERELNIAQALRTGVQLYGHTLTIKSPDEYKGPDNAFDLACVFGVKGIAKEFLIAHKIQGMKTLFFDKGYLDRGVFMRVAVNGFHPTGYMRKKRNAARIRHFNITLKDSTRRRRNVMLVSSSQKYHNFQSLGNATKYCTKLIQEIRQETDLKILYRPKPSWNEAIPITGSSFMQEPRKFQQVIKGCAAIITHGSSASIEGMIEGIPSIVLSDHPMSLLSPSSIDQLKFLRLPNYFTREQFLNDISYCQWTIPEMASGEMWDIIKEDL